MLRPVLEVELVVGDGVEELRGLVACGVFDSIDVDIHVPVSLARHVLLKPLLPLVYHIHYLLFRRSLPRLSVEVLKLTLLSLSKICGVERIFHLLVKPFLLLLDLPLLVLELKLRSNGGCSHVEGVH